MNPNVSRTGPRLIRLAYDLEAIAARLREAGYDIEAGSVRAAARECSASGNSLMDKLGTAE